MKKGVLIIVMIFLVRPVLPVLEYIINYDFIVAELCENRDKPVLECNGKCHLMKELAKASEDEKPLSEKKTLHLQTELLFLEPVNNVSIAIQYNYAKKSKIIPYSNLYSSINSFSIFHPPVV